MGTAYIRARRNDRWVNLPFEEMTREEFAERFPDETTVGWLCYFAEKVQELQAFLASEGYVLAEPEGAEAGDDDATHELRTS